jgi:hypothetical protein
MTVGASARQAELDKLHAEIERLQKENRVGKLAREKAAKIAADEFERLGVEIERLRAENK